MLTNMTKIKQKIEENKLKLYEIWLYFLISLMILHIGFIVFH